MKVINWLGTQAELQAGEFRTALRTYYPQHSRAWSNVAKHIEFHSTLWNDREAAQMLDWSGVLHGQNLKVLDLG